MLIWDSLVVRVPVIKYCISVAGFRIGGYCIWLGGWFKKWQKESVNINGRKSTAQKKRLTMIIEQIQHQNLLLDSYKEIKRADF